MAVKPAKKGSKQPKPALVEEREEDATFEDENGDAVDLEGDDVDDEKSEVEAEDDEDLELEPARVQRVKKGQLYVALAVVRVNPAPALPDKSHHMGDVHYVGGPPFAITDQESAKELLRDRKIRPATDRDIRQAEKAEKAEKAAKLAKTRAA